VPVPPHADAGVSKDQRTLSGLRLPELGEQPDRGTVLLVEDHPLNRELIKQQLEALGFAVDAVDDGEAAVQRWRIVPCIAVVTDIQLPGMSGYALATALRQQGATLPILAVSAMAPPGDQQRCLDAGITELLFKPLSLERLGHALGAQLGLLRERVMPSIRGGRLPDHVRRLFVEAGRDDLDALQAARQEGDVQALRQRLHAVKGVLQMIGEADTARLFLALEHQCETRGAVAQDLWSQAIEAMQALLAGHAEDISAP
jgi:two-component system capsular synthesis sensor histidine kinase RcsC